MQLHRILLKLSGESLSDNDKQSISPTQLNLYAEEIESIKDKGIEIAIVIGGGNIFRGFQGLEKGISRVQGDYIGMLATVINSMALQGALDQKGIKSVVLSGFKINPIAELMSQRRAKEYLSKGFVVIIAGGTGNPFFTTDSASALRALEIEADAMLKGTRVDGVYSDDPEKNKNAIKYTQISFEEAYQKQLKIMDLTAFTLCRDNNMPVIVFDINKKGNLLKIINGENVGTIVKNV